MLIINSLGETSRANTGLKPYSPCSLPSCPPCWKSGLVPFSPALCRIVCRIFLRVSSENPNVPVVPGFPGSPPLTQDPET